MTVRSDPTVRRRKLGAELRRLRDEAGKKLVEIAEELNCSQAKISHIEAGKYKVQPRDVRDMLIYYGVQDKDLTAALIDLAHQSAQKSWWHPYNSGVPDWFGTYVGLEAEANTVRMFAPVAIPGLLQTEDYARALTGVSLQVREEMIDDIVNLRKARQSRLSDAQPLELWTVIAEPVLRRGVGTPEVLRGQLDHLITMAKQSNVHLHVLPTSAGLHPGMFGPSILLSFPPSTYHDVVYLEHEAGALYLEEPDDVQRYTTAFDHLCAEALGRRKSIELIRQIARELA